ncbi:MAG: beta-glycosidase [Paludibacter sp.]|nr:beta-glycosidase [Paludibacter sp.]
MKSKFIVLLFSGVVFSTVSAQTFECFSSKNNDYWRKSTVKVAKKSTFKEVELKSVTNVNPTFQAWGTCFNELGWDALNLLPQKQRDSILYNIFSPNGDLKVSMGRIPMNANDYARDWYSCDEVAGDFQLKYFNIERDKRTLIPFIKEAQRYNPSLTFWLSPWSPPSWMKVNGYYSVKSDKAYNNMPAESEIVLFDENSRHDNRYSPKKAASNDYLIQDDRYLKSYANYFCKFIGAYKEEGIAINKIFFQNEPWSYTVYPGCAWTPEGIIRFNADYLFPVLKEKHPGVDLYFGTINTNRFGDIDKVLSKTSTTGIFKGVGFQWEGGQILPTIREKYPNYKYVMTESECGWGSFDWKAAEHTFGLINHYLTNGVEEYTFWNAILSDSGVSTWGWKQNALIRIDSKTKAITYSPEYYAVKHYTHFISKGSRLFYFNPRTIDKLPIMVFKTDSNKTLVFVGNFNDEHREISLKVNQGFLNIKLDPHSIKTFVASRV